MPPKETNDKRYEESQKQRELERNIRYAKRDALMADAMGDKEAFNKAAFKVKTARNAYVEFIKDTGRTERLERKQGNGYNRSINGNGVKKYPAGALDRNTNRANEHAERYYEAVRKMKTDVNKISKNTGIKNDDIRYIR